MFYLTKEEAAKILNLPLKSNYSSEEITKAYREAMKTNHPDHGGTDEMAKKINDARTFLRTYYINYSKSFDQKAQTQNYNEKPKNKYQNNQPKENIKRDKEYYSKEYIKKINEYFKKYVITTEDNDLNDRFVKLLIELEKARIFLNESELRDYESLRIRIKNLLYKEIYKYIEDFCKQKGIITDELSKYLDDSIFTSIPIHTDYVIEIIKERYIEYQEDYLEKLAKDRNDCDWIIKEFDYSALHPIKVIEKLFYEKANGQYENRDNINKILDSKLTIKNNIKSIKNMLDELFKKIQPDSSDYQVLNELKQKLEVFKKNTEILLSENFEINNPYIYAKQEAEKLLEEVMIVFKEYLNNSKDEGNIDTLEQILIIDLSKIKIPLIYEEYMNIKVKIQSQELKSIDNILEEFNNIKYKFCEYYGIEIEKLKDYKIRENVGYNDGTKYDSYGFRKNTYVEDIRFDFNVIDSKLSAFYQKYILNYIKRIFNNSNNSIEYKIKHEIVKEIFTKDIYTLKIIDIDEILEKYLGTEKKATI